MGRRGPEGAERGAAGAGRPRQRDSKGLGAEWGAEEREEPEAGNWGWGGWGAQGAERPGGSAAEPGPGGD